MKKKLFINLSIRLRFIFMIMLELVCVSLISWLVMDVLHISAVPNIVWIILASVTAGGVLNNFLSIRYFGPVLKLKKAMQQVAEGDFSVRLETEKQMKEIRDIYSNFNLMVQELEATEILQTDFVSNVSHEFKTPISAIEGYATLLQDDDMLYQKSRSSTSAKYFLTPEDFPTWQEISCCCPKSNTSRSRPVRTGTVWMSRSDNPLL